MNIFEKYPEMTKGRLTAMVGRVSRLIDAGKTVEEISIEIRQPIDFVNDLVKIKEHAEKNRK